VLACGGQRGSSDGDRPFRVALLTPGPISDQSWNAGAYAGLLQIRDSLSASISHIQTKTPTEFEENFREYGRQGFALVFGHGFEFQDAALRVAPAFPRTTYVVTSGAIAGENYAGMDFSFDEPSFVAGILAAAVSKTGVLGVIGGTELPPVRVAFQAFAEGAKLMNPGVQVLTSYVGNWEDVSAGKEQALAQISRGADVIFQDADAAGLGVFQAARETKKALVVGSNSNQNGVAPDVVLGSVVIDLPKALLLVARAVQAGRFPKHVIELGAATGVVSYVPNPALEARVPASARSLADSAWKELVAGRLRTTASATND
jgi:basic membrane lipoprotein Med (substrate-binding protein (PBP1-ABC) superfamily)